MFSFSFPELGLILVIALIIFGPGKLPEVGKALGKSLHEFRRSVDSSNNEPTVVEVKPLEKKSGESDQETKKAGE